MRWLHPVLTPVFAVASFLAAFYALLLSPSRADWWLVVPLAVATIASAGGAFVLRKTQPNTALALVIMPAALLFPAIALPRSL